MTVHGLRIYHKDLLRVFRPIAAEWRGHVFANDFALSTKADGTIDDPLPALRRLYGSSLLSVDVESQLVLLRGDDFCGWGASVRFCEGALLPIFRGALSFELPKRLCGDRDFRLTSDTWPTQLRALLQMWDGVCWQLFTTQQSDVDELIRVHGVDPAMKLYFVDLEREYPDPSNQKLIAARPNASGDA